MRSRPGLPPTADRAVTTVLRNDEAMTEMANNPQLTKNATDEALAAVEDALSLRAPAERVEPQLIAEPGIDLGGETPPVTADLFRDNETAPHWPSADSAPRLPANDDRANMGQILQTLRRRRARAPYAIASIAALGWIAGAGATAILLRSELLTLLATPGIGIAAAIAAVCGVVVPVIFFYVIAHMFSRSQDMRLCSLLPWAPCAHLSRSTCLRLNDTVTSFACSQE